MNIKSFFRVIRRRWKAMLITMLAVAALGIGFTYLTPRVYQASTETMLTATGGSTNSDRVSGSTYAQSQMPSYMEVATSQIVLGPVIANLGLNTDPQALASRLDVEVLEGTSVIQISASADSAEGAATLAGDVTSQFVDTVERMETPAGESESNIEATIIREASVPDSPASPVVWRNIALAVLVGALLGLLVALIRERTDPAVRAPDEAEELSGLPVLGRIPLESKKAHQTMGGRVGSPRVEAFNALRTNLQFVQTAGESSAFVVTSARPGEGKSTTVAHLANSLAAGGHRVLVIDADLRRSKLAEYLGLVEHVGLTNVLIGNAALEDIVQVYGSSDVHVLGAGPTPPNPVELLSSQAMVRLLDRAQAQYDLVLIDAPPVLPVTDAAILGRHTGNVILVVGLGVAERDDIPQSIENLRRGGANIVGMVVNRVPDVESAASYGYSSTPMAAALPTAPEGVTPTNVRGQE